MSEDDNTKLPLPTTQLACNGQQDTTNQSDNTTHALPNTLDNTAQYAPLTPDTVAQPNTPQDSTNSPTLVSTDLPDSTPPTTPVSVHSKTKLVVPPTPTPMSPT